MLNYTDMHIHALYGVDDGVKTEEMMLAMVDAEYQDGVRFLCLTPHYHPGYFGDNRDAVLRAYEQLCRTAEVRWPDLKLGLGNELRYDRGCLSWLRDGLCHTMNGSNYVLVDFIEDEENGRIHQALDRLLNAGYTPILAHAERYSRMKEQDIREFRENGVLIQVDTQSLFRGFGFFIQRRCTTLLKSRLVDLAGSDAHDLSRRPPGISDFSKAIGNLCGKDYAAAICSANTAHALFSAATMDTDWR